VFNTDFRQPSQLENMSYGILAAATGLAFKQENVLNDFPAMQFSEAMKPLGSEGEAGQ
jgi:hypothetical protein